jgi:hypothetical protein
MKAKLVRFCLLAVVASGVLSQPLAASEPAPDALTFFGWSDQHVQTDGDAKHLVPAIDAMNGLPGTAYPESIGGKVSAPAFVFGCGDITEWPTHAAMKAYDQLITRHLKHPAYDILGNHDEGGKVPSETMRNWLVSRHGSLSYTFRKKGIQFIAVFSKYDESLNNPAQPITEDALNFLRTCLAEVPPETPVIVALHLCFDAITNRDKLIEAIGNANVIAILGGHYHQAKVDRYGGRNFVQLPSPATGSPSEFTVFRVAPDRIVAIPYDYERKTWSDHPKKLLDLRLSPPR